MRLRSFAATTLALAFAACGSTQGAARDEFRARCEALVPGTTTVLATRQSLSETERSLPCRDDLKKLGADDVCPYAVGQTPICELVYEFPTTDCSGPLAGGACADYCIVRVSTANPGPGTVLCARQWLGSQTLFDAPGARPAP